MRAVPVPLDSPVGPTSAVRELTLAVVIRARPGITPWSDLAWKVEQVLVGTEFAQDPAADRPTPLPAKEGEQTLLWSGLRVAVFPDQGESYYFNLLVDSPKVFVVCASDPRNGLRPELITLDYDEAMSHVETDEDVQSAPMPPEMVHWLEGFVLENYVPERKSKRRRVAWSPCPDTECRHGRR